MKDKLIKDIEVKLAMCGYSAEETERIVHCVIGCLDSYDVTEAVTDLTVRYEDINERILKRYVVCMQIEGKPESTIRQYLWSLRKLSDTIHKSFTDMGANDIKLFLGSLKASGCKNSYIKGQRARISALCKWMLAEDLIEKDPCAKVGDIKVEQEVRLPFSSVEIDRMRSAITGRNAIRDRAIIETLLSSGIRCQELCDLQISDIDIRTRTLHVRKGKGGKGRMGFISEVAADYIGKYIESRCDGAGALFVTKRGSAFGVSGIENLLRKYGRVSGVQNVHPHRFRRTFATTMHKRGMDLEEIRRLMGHSNVQTTIRYIYADDSQLQASYNKYAA